MSVTVEGVERVLEQLREDRLAFFELLPDEIQDRFFAALGNECERHREEARRAEVDTVAWHRPPRVGRLWFTPKHPRRPRLRAIEGDRDREDVLREIAPPDYFAAIAGRDVPVQGGMTPCPFHEDRTPSCKVYAEADDGWYSFCCGRGGTVIDLAGELWGLDTRRDFPELRRRIAQTLLTRVAA